MVVAYRRVDYVFYLTLALAVYNRSPSAYEALRDLSILQLPCTKVLKKVLKDGAEQPGIDHRYFESQQEKFKAYQRERESGGHPRPLGIGVLMWDEVKVRDQQYQSFQVCSMIIL